MKKSKVLAEAEIERRQTKIVEKSREITTLSTLTAALDAYNDRLLKQDQTWRAKLARLASKVDAYDDSGNPILDPKTQKPVKVDIMSKGNPAWRNRIVL